MAMERDQSEGDRKLRDDIGFPFLTVQTAKIRRMGPFTGFVAGLRPTGPAFSGRQRPTKCGRILSPAASPLPAWLFFVRERVKRTVD